MLYMDECVINKKIYKDVHIILACIDNCVYNAI